MATNITAITDSVNASAPPSPRQFQGIFKEAIPFTFIATDATLAAQVAGQCDVTVTGAALGDFVLLAPGADVAAQTAYAYVSAANVVTITTFNVEGTDADTSLSAGVRFYGVVLKRSPNLWGV
jgi:hypothetical protein